jgi:tripartite-type tricarboxylate transporter receptor subunit TctC
MGGEQFKFVAGINIVHVPYRGTPEALIDTMTGRIQYWFSPLGPALPFVTDKRLLALAVSTAQRSPLFPDVPTVAEVALPGFDYDTWYGLFAPAKTPRPVVNQLNQELARIVSLADVKERMQLQGAIIKRPRPKNSPRCSAPTSRRLRRLPRRRTSGLTDTSTICACEIASSWR